jgi:hypothetical protein
MPFHAVRSAAAREAAIQEISRAIDEIKIAARDDGRNPFFTPPPQGGDPAWPMHSAVRLLRARHNDSSMNPGWNRRFFRSR